MSNKGIDCSVQITAAVAAALVSDGYSFACRYLVPVGYSKRLTATEAQVLTDAGLLILCVYETTAGRAQVGAANGTVDGAAALACAQELNMPTSACIFFAVDYDATDMAPIAEYLKAAKAQIGDYMIGVYGSYSVVEAMRQRGVADVLWQTYAWSGGQAPVNATVYQYKNDQTVAGISVDLNEAYSTSGMWNYETEVTPVADTTGNTPSSWAAASVAKAQAKGIIKGDENGNLKLQDNVTRESLMVFLDRLGLLG